jgi:Flp pilus assembly protein TadG
MRRIFKRLGRQSEDGVIAVEAAFVLPILLLSFALPSILLAFYFRQYSAAQKAANDAATYLSTAPRMEFTTAGRDGTFAAIAVANVIVANELAGIVPAETSTAPYITCFYDQAGVPKGNLCTPQLFQNDNSPLSRFDVAINLPFINPLTGEKINSMYISTIPSVPYLGN